MVDKDTLSARHAKSVGAEEESVRLKPLLSLFQQVQIHVQSVISVAEDLQTLLFKLWESEVFVTLEVVSLRANS